MSTSVSPPPRMSAHDVGAYYIHDDGSVWRLIGYADQPTATLERVDRAQHLLPHSDVRARVGGVVGALIFQGFRRLVPVPDRG